MVELHDVEAALDEALAFTDEPDVGYTGANAAERRLLNQAIWEQLVIHDDTIQAATKTEFYRELDWWAEYTDTETAQNGREPALVGAGMRTAMAPLKGAMVPT